MEEMGMSKEVSLANLMAGKESPTKWIPGEFNVTKQAPLPEEYLATAEEAANYVEQYRIKTADTSYWDFLKEESNNKNLSLYDGSAGIVYFYSMLYKVTNDKKYYDIALSGGNYLAVNWKEQLDYSQANDADNFNLNYYTGVIGIAAVLLHLIKIGISSKYESALQAIADYTIAVAKSDEKGLYWVDSPGFMGDAGITVTLFEIGKILNNNELIQQADKAAKRILDSGKEDSDHGGKYWPKAAQPLFDFNLPNFELGTAGVGYALTLFYQFTGDEGYLEGAKQAAIYVRSIAIKQGDGYLVPYRLIADEKPFFYVGSCHGPNGTSKLFYSLYKITQDKTYLDDIEAFYNGLNHLGAPQKQSTGYWKNTSLCCGTAGLLQFYINAFNVTHDKKYLDSSQVAANILLSERRTFETESGIGSVWPIVYTRVVPDEISEFGGYLTGAAGIATTLLQFYLVTINNFEWHKLSDDPFPENA